MLCWFSHVQLFVVDMSLSSAMVGRFFTTRDVWEAIVLEEAGFSGGSVVKNLPAMQETQRLGSDPWARKILPRRAP